MGLGDTSIEELRRQVEDEAGEDEADVEGVDLSDPAEALSAVVEILKHLSPGDRSRILKLTVMFFEVQA